MDVAGLMECLVSRWGPVIRYTDALAGTASPVRKTLWEAGSDLPTSEPFRTPVDKEEIGFVGKASSTSTGLGDRAKRLVAPHAPIDLAHRHCG